MFADPKQSVVDIVQAAGRAMRTHPAKRLGYIIIPVVLDENEKNKVSDTFKQLVTVIAALGINDERIIDEAKLMVQDPKRPGKILEFVESIPNYGTDFNDFVKQLKIKIWDRVSFAKSVVGETEFNKWMKEQTTLSKASMEKYSRVVRKISNDLVKLNLAYSSLEEITENGDLKRLKNQYFSIDEYKELDTRGNRMYSSGFNRLIEFQSFKKSSNN